jgi:uncharacterized protein YraI
MGISQGGGATGLSGAAGINAICDASPLDLTTPIGIVTTDPLNLRSGPGMDYDILMMLKNCSQLNLLGRSSDGQWLQVSQGQYVSGWVFAQYVTTNVRVNKLPITQYVQPQPSTGTAKVVWVEIQMNYGAAFVKGMPSNMNVQAVISPAGSPGKAVVVGNATTDNAGAAVVSFVMPTTWADGSLVTEQDLVLEATAADGSSANLYITYYVH